MRAPGLIVLLCLSVATTHAADAFGQGASADASTRASARALGEEGNRLFDVGDYKGALEKYERAEALVSVPTLGVRAARCLVKLGRLVEASQRYVEVTRAKLPSDALAVHREAQRQAEAEGDALQARIPYVIVRVPDAGDTTMVSIDGKPVPTALIGEKRATDPGAHRLAVQRGEQTATKEFVLREGETATVELAPPPASGAPAPASPATAPSITPVAPPHGEAPSERAPVSTDSTQASLGWVAIGVGAAGLAAGGIVAALAAGQRSDLEATCGEALRCGTADWDAADRYNTFRTVSTIGFVAGGALAATGIVLLLTAPKGGATSVTARALPRRAMLGTTF